MKMTSSPPSSSDPTGSRAFELLAEPVRRWIWQRGWTSLREVQERAIPVILSGSDDVIVSASTASGKTEAAYFPICSSLVKKPASTVGSLCVSPLKALINDQFQRVEELCEHLGIKVNRWHGDVASHVKKKLLSEPNGILIITPESLEALFVVHGTKIRRLFGDLRYLVVDELHSFMGSERGRQLQSLLHRLDAAIGKTIPRIGLSATLADMHLAAEFLRPGEADAVQMVTVPGEQALLLQVRGYRAKALKIAANEKNEAATEDALAIAQHIAKKVRGSKNLVFANSRARVEIFADLLGRLSERENIPNEFWPHHGSLARELREDVERMLKEKDRPLTVVCTSTLEMGIDVGAMKSIVQIGAPPSVASLRQRLGRSGRQEGEPAILRIYASEAEIEPGLPLQDCLRPELIQSIAMVRLMLRKWCEPAQVGAVHLSTLTQQILSTIAEKGGVTARDAWRVLCRTGPFRRVDQRIFARLLKCLAARDLIQQSQDGTLFLGVAGERVVNHYSFFTAFVTAEEYRIVEGSRELGSMPIRIAIGEGMFIIFAGRRWRVLSVDEARRLVQVEASEAGRAPQFAGLGGAVHGAVRQEMQTVLSDSEIAQYLDAGARDLLAEARSEYRRLGLDHQGVIEHGDDVVLFPWAGDAAMDTLVLRLRGEGFGVGRDAIALSVENADRRSVESALRSLLAEGCPQGLAQRLARLAENRIREKYDSVLDDELMALEHANRALDMEASHDAIRRLLGEPPAQAS